MEKEVEKVLLDIRVKTMEDLELLEVIIHTAVETENNHLFLSGPLEILKRDINKNIIEKIESIIEI